MKLPVPNISNDLRLLEAIQNRYSTRRFLDEELPLEVISNILYVAAGELQPASNTSKSKRTIPSARNSQCIEVYAVTKEGVFSYDETTHSLKLLQEGNYIDKLSTQTMMHNAPFGLLYVADLSKLSMYTATNNERMISVSSFEAGCMSQNVSLYTGSIDLGSVVVGLVQREFFAELLDFKDKRVLYSQVIGKKSNP